MPKLIPSNFIVHYIRGEDGFMGLICVLQKLIAACLN